MPRRTAIWTNIRVLSIKTVSNESREVNAYRIRTFRLNLNERLRATYWPPDGCLQSDML